MRQSIRLTLMAIACLAIVPSAAYAQASITGVVRDTSGAVLPGVTVEATSPALIEKVRSVVTDGTGQYRIENLRPGAYTVTFTLPGFATIRREGIQLTGSFVASVNVELRVGALEETITVTGETPIVDVQSTTRQSVIDREMIAALPTGQNAATIISLMPSVTTRGGGVDLSGIDGEARFSPPGGQLVRGVNEPRTLVGGLSIHSAQGSGQTGVGNLAAYQEIVVDTGGISVEQAEGGVRVNMIPRDGGNSFQGAFYNAFANSSMQGDNFTQDLRDRGLGTPNSLKRFWDIYGALGGPIKRDKLWFHGTSRYNVSHSFVPIFVNKNAGNPNAWTYEPDTGQPAVQKPTWKGANARVTWQATARHKLAAAFDYAEFCRCPVPSATTTLEASEGVRAILRPMAMGFGDWTVPVTNRLLFEAKVFRYLERGYRPTVNAYFIHDPGPVKLNAVTEQSNNLTYRGVSGAATDTWNKRFLSHVTMSYVTGAHAFKVGFNHDRASQNQLRFSIDSPMSFRFGNGVPNQLTLQATPYRNLSNSTDSALFAQDKWTVNRVTLNAGLRYDYFHSYFPAMTIGPGEFVPTRNIVLPATDGVRWHDLQPRSGLAFDVFGDGKTALKASLNKYLAFYGLSNFGRPFTTAMALASRLVTVTNRSWQDANRNFVPDCNLTNPLVNGECGAMSSSDFGSSRPVVTYDPETLSGWGLREYNWQFSAGVQHEVLPRVSLDVSYFRTWFGNFVVTDNRAVSPSDFDRFSITAPVDPRLPGGGHVISGLYDLKPAAFGRPADELLTLAKNYGKQIEHWNGVDVTVNARPRPGVLLQGGTNTQRKTTDNCEVLAQVPESNPVGLPYCHVNQAFLTQLKFLASYTVPRIDVQVSGTFQSLPGPEILANYVATNAVVAPSLGRNLAGGTSNVTVNLVEPGTMFGERTNQIDLRIGKILRFGRTRANASLDLYNLLNANPVLTLNNAFAAWQRPLSILNPRFAKVVVQLDF